MLQEIQKHLRRLVSLNCDGLIKCDFGNQAIHAIVRIRRIRNAKDITDLDGNDDCIFVCILFINY